MTYTFSVLSLKRNRSSSNNNNNSNNKEPVSKLSKIKSGLTKLGNSITHHNDNNLDNRRTSLIGLFQYFRNNEEQKGTIDNDINYEYNQYYNIKKNQKKRDMERNIHTLPINSTPKLTSILIKRSGTTPSSLSQSKRYNNNNNNNNKLKRSLSNTTLSNMTINSEDLTAKEFANIAGIRILPEEEQEGEEERKFSTEDLVLHTISSSSNYTTQSYFNDTSSFTYSLQQQQQQQQQNHDLKIWDNQFWFHPQVSSKKKIILVDQLTTINNLDRKLSIKSLNDPPILHELRKMSTCNSEKDACILKKGRFEIQLGTLNNIISTTTTTNTTVLSNNHHIVNWKRKGKNPI